MSAHSGGRGAPVVFDDALFEADLRRVGGAGHAALKAARRRRTRRPRCRGAVGLPRRALRRNRSPGLQEDLCAWARRPVADRLPGRAARRRPSRPRVRRRRRGARSGRPPARRLRPRAPPASRPLAGTPPPLAEAPRRHLGELEGVPWRRSPTGRHASDPLQLDVTLAVRSALMPVWTQVEAPEADAPYWRDAADGQRRHVHELVVGASPTDRAAVEREHAAAIATIAAAAMAAWRDGDGATARRLARAASRLSEEIVGFWPTSVDRRAP